MIIITILDQWALHRAWEKGQRVLINVNCESLEDGYGPERKKYIDRANYRKVRRILLVADLIIRAVFRPRRRVDCLAPLSIYGLLYN